MMPGDLCVIRWIGCYIPKVSCCNFQCLLEIGGTPGHEHLNQFGIINMNARLYDPLLVRFLAPDPYVGSGMANDFNRYIYCKNNPLMFTRTSKLLQQTIPVEKTE